MGVGGSAGSSVVLDVSTFSGVRLQRSVQPDTMASVARPSTTGEASAEDDPRLLLHSNADTVPPIVPGVARAERFGYVDALRGLAVVLMVQQHLGVWLTSLGKLGTGLLPLMMSLNALGGAAAPLFVFLAGVGTTLGAHLSGSALARRGLALAFVGYLLNFACPSWFSPGTFYVLHLIAVFWLLAPGLRRLSDGALVAIFVLLLLATIGVQTWLGTPPYLSNARLADTSLELGPLRLALAEGHFPVLPWLAFATLGLWAGRRLGGPAQVGSSPATFAPGSLYVTSAVLLAGYVAARVPTYILRPGQLRRLPLRSLVDFSFYPATVAFVLGLSAVAIVLLALAATWASKGRRSALWLVALGRSSLTLLFVHVVLFCQGSVALGLNRRVPPVWVLVVIACVLGLWAAIARAWAHRDFRYSLEWWIRKAGQAGAGRPSPGR